MLGTVSTRSGETKPKDAGTRPAAPARDFERWGIAAYLLVVAALVAAIGLQLRGTFVYVLDDPAIHLSMADTLVNHGTWGVSAGSFESASSSPLWTSLVGAGLWLSPGSGEWVPLALNIAVGIAIVVLFGRSQSILQPDRRRPLDAVAVVVLVVVALFLPGLTIVGMEHSLHVLLVLAAVVAFQRREWSDAGDAGGADRGLWPTYLPYVLVVLATLTRFETAFVVAGLTAGLLVTPWVAGRDWQESLRRRARSVGLLIAAGVVPLAGFALINRLAGGGFLPNPVLVKGQGPGAENTGNTGLGPIDTMNRLAHDSLLLVLVAIAGVYLVMTWQAQARFRVTAITFVVASLLHAMLADMGWYGRYQAYLLAIGLYLMLGIISELPASVRYRALTVLVVLTVALTVSKANLLVKAPVAANDMYRHHYQAGLFLDRYYDGQPIGTDQLGYLTFFHDGPMTDFAGLGDYEALQRRPAQRSDLPEFLGELTAERGTEVVVLYDAVALFRVPEDWVLVGEFSLAEKKPFVAVSQNLSFYAPTPEAVRPLQENLLAFEPDLPAGVTLKLNEWAELQAGELMNESSLTPASP